MPWELMLVPALGAFKLCSESPQFCHLLPGICDVFQEAVSAWGDPAALVKPMPEIGRELLLYVGRQAERGIYRHAEARHHAALDALLQYLREFDKTPDVT